MQNTKIQKYMGYLCLLTMMFLSSQAFAVASIEVDGVQRYFIAGESPVQNITVTNNSDKSMSIRTSIAEYTHPAEDQGSTNVREVEANDAFIFAPKLFKLKPYESRQVRMVLAKPMGNVEKVYTVSFDPFDFEYEAKDAEGEIKMNIGFIATNGILVTVSPKKPVINVDMKRDLNGYAVFNKGNVSIDLTRKYNHCYDEEKTDCEVIEGKRVYPGSSHYFELDAGKSLLRPYKVYDKRGGEINIPSIYNQ